MGCRCCADRLAPAPPVPEQRGLLLHAGNGDTEVVVAAQAKRRLPEAPQQPFDGRVIDRITLDYASVRVGFIGKKLERADAIPADGREQAVSIGPGRTDPFRDAAAQCLRVGQKILEDRADRSTTIRIFTQRQRKRDGDGILPAEPAVVIAEADRAAGLLEEMADETVVEIDAQRCMLAAPRHQNMSSISAACPFDRGPIWNSRSSAASTARRVSILLAGLPASISEIVSWRRPALSPSCVWLHFRCLRARRTRLPICFGLRATFAIGHLWPNSDNLSISGLANKADLCGNHDESHASSFRRSGTLRGWALRTFS